MKAYRIAALACITAAVFATERAPVGRRTIPGASESAKALKNYKDSLRIRAELFETIKHVDARTKPDAYAKLQHEFAAYDQICVMYKATILFVARDLDRSIEHFRKELTRDAYDNLKALVWGIMQTVADDEWSSDDFEALERCDLIQDWTVRNRKSH